MVFVPVIVFVFLIAAVLLVLLRSRSWMRLLAGLHLHRMRLFAMFRRDRLRAFMYLRRRCRVLLLRYDLRLFAALLRKGLAPLVRLRPGFHARLRLGFHMRLRPFW